MSTEKQTCATWDFLQCYPTQFGIYLLGRDLGSEADTLPGVDGGYSLGGLRSVWRLRFCYVGYGEAETDDKQSSLGENGRQRRKAETERKSDAGSLAWTLVQCQAIDWEAICPVILRSTKAEAKMSDG